MLLRGLPLGALYTNVALAIKVVLLVYVFGLLSYVHLILQPKIDDLFAQAGEGTMLPELAAKIGAFRKRRTRFATSCLFCVLIISLMALQVWVMYPLWLNVVLLGAIIVFTWRTFNSYMAYGWW